ncbi:MAG: hypothetical protein J6A44_00090 [Paludibacteraceae bacterium]|nr:hypothetical protein [Paludibacteraceae bacterium]
MKDFYFIFFAFLFLFVGCENNQIQIVHRKKSGIIADGEQINMLYTRQSEYIKLINDTPLFAVCVFDTKTDYGEDYIKVFNHLTPLLEEEYGFVPELVVDFCGHTIFTPGQHTYYNWGDDIYVDQILPLEDYFYDVYNMSSSLEYVFELRSFYEERRVMMHVSESIDLMSPDPTGLPYDPVMGLYYDGAVIKWNGDTSNTNGVLVMVEWSGDHTDNDYPDSFVINADIVPDNGECVLDNRLFQGIPHGAIIKLSILRANIADVENFEFAEGLFTDITFATVSQCLRAHIVLIREMP